MAEPRARPDSAKEPITQWLDASRQGDEGARERLFAALYAELRRSASRELRKYRGIETLETTALVHETFLRLLSGTELPFENRIHLLSVAGVAMRRLLVDRARERFAVKRGGGALPATLDTEAEALADKACEDLLALDEALDQLARLDPRLARVVELRFFGGLTEAETAAALASSERTVRRDWTKARAFLHRHLSST